MEPMLTLEVMETKNPIKQSWKKYQQPKTGKNLLPTK